MEHENFIWSWLTYGWLIKNMNIIIFILIFTIIILFIFPLLLGYDIKKETSNQKRTNDEKKTK